MEVQTGEYRRSSRFNRKYTHANIYMYTHIIYYVHNTHAYYTHILYTHMHCIHIDACILCAHIEHQISLFSYRYRDDWIIYSVTPFVRIASPKACSMGSNVKSESKQTLLVPSQQEYMMTEDTVEEQHSPLSKLHHTYFPVWMKNNISYILLVEF